MTELERRFKKWLFEGMKEAGRQSGRQRVQDAWYRVMCLTGVDYFSSLSYQAGIAYLAAGLLSPVATLFLVFVTLFGAVPIYYRVAEASPHGQGSIAMLESLLPGWKGKLLVLTLLGFAATDFVITITLSAADAAQHIVENPYARPFLLDRMSITLLLITLLGAVFLAGFREAIGLAVVLVVTYLLLNAVVICAGLAHIAENPELVSNWRRWLRQTHSLWAMLGFSALLFPKLALGLSGFETGVAVMPLIAGDPADTSEAPLGRIRRTKHLLLTAALIMSVFLLGSSFVCSLIIPAELFAEGQPANGRAIAFLAHKFLGETFGTVYDVSTIAILWFAGASAMAGLLSLVPRYLPRYGMAPEWARAARPNAIFFTLVAYVVTVIFRASVDAQAGAYATGVLVLITSAALAVLLALWERGWWQRIAFMLVTLAFSYTTIANCIERPEGLHIASFFIATIIVASILSRAWRSTELRIKQVALDDTARQFLAECHGETLRLIGHPPGRNDYAGMENEVRQIHNMPEGKILFLEVHLSDPSEFTDEVLEVSGIQKGEHRVLTCTSPAVPNALAALLLTIRDATGKTPHLYLSWTEGNIFKYILRFLFLGVGETATMTREVLRQAEPDPSRRPRVHVA